MKIKKKAEPINPPILVSEVYNLNSAELEFFNIDLNNDNFAFMCPYMIENIAKLDIWAKRFTDYSINYFEYLRKLLKENKRIDADRVFNNLNEFNYTRLGMSDHGFYGKGINFKANDFLDEILDNGFVLLEHVTRLQDIKLYVPGIKDDKVSDAFSNIVKLVIIEYTQQMCNKYGIPMKRMMVKNVWNNDSKTWIDIMTELPVYNNKPFVLLPKSCVTDRSWYNAGNFANKVILDDIRQKYIDDKDRPTKKAIKEDLKRQGFIMNKSFVRKYLIEHQDSHVLHTLHLIDKRPHNKR